jgi:hypothetical protein
MNPTSDTTTSSGSGGDFDPRQAAALLDQTTAQARRKLAPSPPWLLAARGVAVLAAIGFVIVNFAATVGVREHAMTGVRGQTRFRPAEIIVLTLSWVAVPLLMWGLAAAGASFAWYPTTVLIIPGLAWAAVQARREGWRGTAVGLGLAATGVAGAFAGPAGSWAVAGLGVCAVLLAQAAAVARRQRQMTA